eukprot:CAMPEP_0171255972 /NCGR_PEP_ID=MMETSP0790-20130122/53050_1 /TAXON_ID=2925 /ORGANISM="Alexandrium catenella, Strain OF101" /LENGTH=69 /DNA_ID=CAMNT_0011723957 /DNA_START=1 /DNA_END=206 /DNA_ORIENTATION=-
MASVAWGEKEALGAEDGPHFHASCLGKAFQEGMRRVACKDSSSLAMHFEVAGDTSSEDSDRPGAVWDSG